MRNLRGSTPRAARVPRDREALYARRVLPSARAALPAFCVLVALGAGPATPRPPGATDPLGSAGAGQTRATPCPPRTLPDGDECILIDEPDPGDAPLSAESENAHRTRGGRWEVYDDIPRRPDRPADYDAYRYPVSPGVPGGHAVVSGFDLDQPDERQRRGKTLHAVGHGGVDLPQARGTPVRAVALEHQVGDAEVLYVGDYFGTTVMTRQAVHEGGSPRDYLVVFGHMDSVAAGVNPGRTLKDGDLVGTVGDTGSPELVHLHWEVRRFRPAVDVHARAALGPGELMADWTSIVCDPRNVLPLR